MQLIELTKLDNVALTPDEFVNYKTRFDEQNVLVEIKNINDYKYKFNFVIDNQLIYSFNTDKLTMNFVYNNEDKTIGMPLEVLKNHYTTNSDIPEKVKDELTLANAFCYEYLYQKKVNQDLAAGIVQFNIKEITDMAKAGTLIEYLEARVSESFAFKTGHEMNQLYGTTKMKEGNDYAIIKLDSYTELLIEEQKGEHKTAYAGVVTSLYNDVRKSHRVHEIAALDRKALRDVLEPAIKRCQPVLEKPEYKPKPRFKP